MSVMPLVPPEDRDGRASRPTSGLDLKLTTPEGTWVDEAEEGANPERLFAAGYSACFIGAMQFVAAREKIAIPPDTSVEEALASAPFRDGFGIEAELKISLPGMPREAAQDLINKAHKVCPYSNATRNSIDVTLAARLDRVECMPPAARPLRHGPRVTLAV